MLNIAKHNDLALRSFLKHLGQRDAVLSYHQIQGLLYAMACSPEPVKPAEWFELIWLSDEPQFDDVAEAKAFFQLLLELSRGIGEAAQHERYRPGIDDDGDCSVAALAGWCDGFLMGHQYLEDLWLLALDDLNDDRLYEQVAATLDWAAAFVEGEIVDWAADDNGDGLIAAYVQLQQLLDDYYAVHRQWLARDWPWDVAQSFAALEGVGRDDLCPCGSGRVFMRCCLH
jgi:uncharacterized protein